MRPPKLSFNLSEPINLPIAFCRKGLTSGSPMYFIMYCIAADGLAMRSSAIFLSLGLPLIISASSGSLVTWSMTPVTAFFMASAFFFLLLALAASSSTAFALAPDAGTAASPCAAAAAGSSLGRLFLGRAGPPAAAAAAALRSRPTRWWLKARIALAPVTSLGRSGTSSTTSGSVPAFLLVLTWGSSGSGCRLTSGQAFSSRRYLAWILRLADVSRAAANAFSRRGPFPPPAISSASSSNWTSSGSSR
mmetsp:Transcript_150690/g.420037  ORF Transcript_150690/g.420037 Transcript_150690/m.420037 type:complete len:248 (+) Transcript_150690:165-908(+)